MRPDPRVPGPEDAQGLRLAFRGAATLRKKWFLTARHLCSPASEYPVPETRCSGDVLASSAGLNITAALSNCFSCSNKIKSRIKVAGEGRDKGEVYCLCQFWRNCLIRNQK